MPHEVIMPALGMAQDTGQILAWHKKPGEAVSAGDVLFEVETDKAAMEVEAPKPGYLTDVTAEAGSDVPVGQVIALISETPAGKGSTQPPETEAGATVVSEEPAGVASKNVIMPTLGMAQDTGLLVSWLKQPGDKVSADDVLFEVETDKSTVEVNAGHEGFVAALLAEAGQEIPVGKVIAIISAERPDAPLSRKAEERVSETSVSRTAAPGEYPNDATAAALAPAAAVPKTENNPSSSRILASPKARRLAREQGLDLERLAEAGHAQPFHVKDLEALKALPAKAASGAAAAAARHLTAAVDGNGFDAFAAWAASSAGVSDQNALLAGLLGASLERLPVTVAVEGLRSRQVYTVSSSRLGQVTKSDAETGPDLRVRDLRFSRVGNVHLGAEECPVLSVSCMGNGLVLTLECSSDQLSASEAVALLSNFAGRMEQPLRHLL